MEWEKKFYDIIQETESNLARARLKLHGKSLPKGTPRSFDKHDFLQQSFSSVPPVSKPWDSALDGQLCRSVPVTSHQQRIADMSPHDNQTSEMGQLLSKIDSQNLMIDRLERLVKTLNQEKDQYRRHISNLQYEVGDISMKMNETKYLNPHLETQVDLMRHEVRSDIQRLQNMIGAARNSSLQSKGLERSFKDMQHSVHGELEDLRRDLNSMAHRVGRLELDVTSHNAGQRDLHDRLNLSLLTSSYPGQVLGSRSSPDLSHLKDIRSTVSQLHDKLDSLEGRIVASSVVPSQSPQHLSGLQKLYKTTVMSNYSSFDDDDLSSDLDDLDLSDLDLSSDDDDDVGDLSDDLEQIMKSSPKGSATTGRIAKTTLADLNLSASDGLPSMSSEGADLSSLDLDNLDLSSPEDSVDLDSMEGGNLDLKLGDL